MKPDLYIIKPTEILTDRGQVVCLVLSPRGVIEGVITLPAEDVARSREKAA